MNCKPGDLAIVAHQSEEAPNLGRIVEVVEWRGEYNGWALWLVRCSTPMNTRRRDTGKPGKAFQGLIPDAWLRPISGVPVHDEQRDEVPV